MTSAPGVEGGLAKDQMIVMISCVNVTVTRGEGIPNLESFVMLLMISNIEGHLDCLLVVTTKQQPINSIHLRFWVFHNLVDQCCSYMYLLPKQGGVDHPKAKYYVKVLSILDPGTRADEAPCNDIHHELHLSVIYFWSPSALP